MSNAQTQTIRHQPATTENGQRNRRLRRAALRQFIIADLERHDRCSADAIATRLETEATPSSYLYIGRRHDFNIRKVEELMLARHDLFFRHRNGTFTLKNRKLEGVM